MDLLEGTARVLKLKILAELSTGNYSKKKLGEIYGINRTTINEWIKKYDRKDLMNTRILWKLRMKQQGLGLTERD